MWATILALIWLHDVKLDAKEEWNLLAKKAMSWLHGNNGESSMTLMLKYIYSTDQNFGHTFSFK